MLRPNPATGLLPEPKDRPAETLTFSLTRAPSPRPLQHCHPRSQRRHSGSPGRWQPAVLRSSRRHLGHRAHLQAIDSAILVTEAAVGFRPAVIPHLLHFVDLPTVHGIRGVALDAPRATLVTR